MGSSSSSGQGTSESSSYIPDYPQSGLLQAISQYAFDHANDTYDWGMEQYNKNQGNIDNLMRNALSYASPQRISVDMGMAESGVQQGAEAGRLNAIRDLESYGIDPSSGRYAALDSANRVMASASAAGAGNQQRMADEAAGNVMRNQALAASLQNTSLGYQAADARNKMLATASSLKYPPLGTKSSSQHTQESQSVTDSGGGGGGKSPQEKPPSQEKEGAPPGGGQQQPSAGRPSQSKPPQQQDKPPKKPGEEEEQQTPGNPLGDPFAPDSGSLAAPGAGPFQSAYDPTNAGLGDQNDIASRSGVDAAGNILGEMPTTEGGWPTYGSDFASGQQQDWGYNPSDLGNFDYLNQGDYQANQYDTFGSPMPNMDDFQTPINGDYENAAPYNVAGGDDSSWQVPGQDWYDQQGQDFSDQSYADQFSQDYGTDGYDNYGDYGDYGDSSGGDTGDTGDTGDYDFGDTSDYGDFGDFADGDYGDYGGDSGDSGDYGDFGDESSFDDFADASAADESNFDDSNYDDSSADDWSDTSSDDYDYGGDGGDSGESDYARGGQVRKRQGMMAQGQRPPRRGPPGGPPPRRGPPPTGYRPGGPPPRPQMMGQRDRPPAPPPTVTARAAAPMPPPLPPRTGYMGPSGQPQGAPPTMMPPQRPPPLGMARGGNIRQQRGGVDPTSGGFVSRSLSPSGGNRTDDVNARLNAGEFVIPKDVAHWKGKEFFHKLIQQARKQHGGGGNGGGAPPTGYGRRQ
jgi:hypothetical protein